MRRHAPKVRPDRRFQQLELIVQVLNDLRRRQSTRRSLENLHHHRHDDHQHRHGDQHLHQRDAPGVARCRDIAPLIGVTVDPHLTVNCWGITLITYGEIKAALKTSGFPTELRTVRA